MITSNTDMDLAKRIRQIRIDNHLTQEQVAKAFLRLSDELILWMRCRMRAYELEMTTVGMRSMRTQHRYITIL